MSAKETIIKEAQAKLKDLESKKKYYESQAQNIPFLADSFKDLSKDLDAEIKKTKEFLATVASSSDLVGTVVTEGAKTAALAVLDNFIKDHGNKEKTLVDVATSSIPVFSVGIISAVVSVGFTLDAKLSSKRDGNKITSEGSIDAQAYIKVGIALGFDVPVIGKVGVEGGIKGNADLSGKATLELEAVVPDLAAYMNPAAIDFGLSADLYLDLPDLPGVATVLGWVADAVGGGLSADDCTLLYRLGSINILTITSPTYSIKFSMSKGNFHSAVKSGKFSAKLNKKVTDAIDYVVAQIKYYAKQLNPVTHLENAYDEVVSWFD